MAGGLKAWRVDADGCQSLDAGVVPTEQALEDWLASTPGMLGDGTIVVGRQIRTAAGPLDLLALDPQGRWVVVELKRSRLHREAIAQVLDYAACVRSLPARELQERLMAGLPALAVRDGVAARIADILAAEGDDGREVAVVVAGIGADEGVERIIDFLAQFGVPVSVISFEAFRVDHNASVLIRAVHDAEAASPTTVDLSQIQGRANSFGVGPQFRRFVDMCRTAGLYARPYTRSVMIAPPNRRNRFLMVTTPMPGGRLRINHGEEAFEEFFPAVTAAEVVAHLGPGGEHVYERQELDRFLDRVARFLDWFVTATARETQPDE